MTETEYKQIVDKLYEKRQEAEGVYYVSSAYRGAIDDALAIVREVYENGRSSKL